MRCPRKLGVSSIIELQHKGLFLRYIQGIHILIHANLRGGLAISSVAAVQERDTNLLKHLAKEFNLTYTAFGSSISTGDGPTAGTLTLTDEWDTALEPAPITPTGEGSAPWQLLSGTIKAAFNAHRGLDGDDNIFVSPGIMTGNTGRYSLSGLLFNAMLMYMDYHEQTRSIIGN
jgi:hypothetical protein